MGFVVGRLWNETRQRRWDSMTRNCREGGATQICGRRDGIHRLVGAEAPRKTGGWSQAELHTWIEHSSRLGRMERKRDEMEGILGRPPTKAEWADATGVVPEEMDRRLAELLRARENLINANLGLVAVFARRHQNMGVPMQDLIQEGSLGLIRGVERFDMKRGVKLSTYVSYWISLRIQRAIANQSRNIRLPPKVHAAILQIRRTTRRLTAELGKEPTDVEVARAMNMSVEKLASFSEYFRDTVSLDVPVGKDSEENLGDLIESGDMSPDERLTQDMIRSDLLRMMKTVLTEREASIIEKRYGLGRGQLPVGRTELANMISSTPARVSSIEKNALRKLRRMLNGHASDYMAAI